MDAETVVSLIFGVALGAFSLLVVGYAFFRPRGGVAEKAAAPVPGGGAAESGSNDGPPLDSVMEAIGTLELEYQLGNLPESQFREQLQAYRIEAAVALRDLVESGRADPTWLLEQEVMEARSALRQEAVLPRVCPGCAAEMPAGVADCPECGRAAALQPSGDQAS